MAYIVKLFSTLGQRINHSGEYFTHLTPSKPELFYVYSISMYIFVYKITTRNNIITVYLKLGDVKGV